MSAVSENDAITGRHPAAPNINKGVLHDWQRSAFKTLRHEERNVPPGSPWRGPCRVFEGYTADEVYQDADKLVESLLEVEKMYAPDGLILLFDLQLEAEILGCTIKWEKNGPPSVRSHPLNRLLKFPISRSLEIPDESLWYWMSRGASKGRGRQNRSVRALLRSVYAGFPLEGNELFRDARQHPSMSRS
ncbi:MAG: uroporphyrinogen decarboxylase family protein [Bilophila wadsworthia]